MTRQYALRYEARPWTLNAERRLSAFERARLVREWRGTFSNLARAHQIPPLAAVLVEVQPLLHSRRSMPDTAACFPAVKAAIDGLVDAHVLTDDGPDIVRGLLFRAPQVAGTDALTLTIIEVSIDGRIALDVTELEAAQ